MAGDPGGHPAPDVADAFGMTDLEEALRGPDGPATAERLLARFDDAQGRLYKEVLRGLPPADYESYQSAIRALAAARDIVLLTRSVPLGD